MAKKDVLEIRITFREDQKELYDYIKEHNSASGFLKDIAHREMLRDNNYINGKFEKVETQNIYPNPYMHYPPNMYHPNVYSSNMYPQQDEEQVEDKTKNKKAATIDVNQLGDIFKKIGTNSK